MSTYIGGVAQDPPVTKNTYYTIGDDVVSQKVDGDSEYLLYDGRGGDTSASTYTV